ncbi:hypothetical protein Bca4012_089947 [Brassica carinata]
MHAAHAPKEESVMITLIDHKEVDIRNVFHCDGLLLCTTKDKRLVVWNPCSGETNYCQAYSNAYKKSNNYALGYDNKSSSKQYKILRMDRTDLPLNNVYEVYDFTTNSWPKYRHGISVKGNTYWVATQAVEKPNHDFILSFDFSTEMFQSLSLPYPFRYGISALSVVREEQLCLLGADLDIYFWDGGIPLSCLQVWVITCTGSWNKSQALVYNTRRYSSSKGMSFLADEQNKVVVFLNTNNMLHVMRQNKNILANHLGGNSSLLLNYVQSLTHIQHATLPGGRKRKAPST